VSSYAPATSYPRAEPVAGVALADAPGLPSGGVPPTSAGPATVAPASFPGELLPRSGRVAPGAYSKTTPDRRKALPFVVAGCAVVVAAAGLWFVAGRGHSTPAPPKTAGAHVRTPRSTATPRPTAKQRAQATAAAENDLRNALTAEKLAYTDQQAYVASPAAMRAVEPTVAWGTRMHLTVGDAVSPGDRGIVCLSETTHYGDTYSIADVALGPAAGTYLGRKPCPARLSNQAVTGLGSRLGP
jgi:hypothetical protein